MDLKLVALVFFILFCASGGIGCLIHEKNPGIFPLPPSVQVGRWVQMGASMIFYGLELLGLIRFKDSVQEGMVNEQHFINGVYLFVSGLTGHSLLYLVFC